jgi:hypothetical protein
MSNNTNQQQQQQQNAWQQYYASAQQQQQPYYPAAPAYPYSQSQYYPQHQQQQPPQQHQQTSSLCPPPPGYNPAYAVPNYNWNQPHQQQYQQQGYVPNAPPLESPNKRQRIEEKPKEAFHCDTCNLTVDSSIALQAHIKSHITCAHCNQFTGSPKLVKAHHQAVHGKFSGRGFKQVTVAVPGLPVQRFRICVGDNPEDIKRWIADRRKKFPRKVVEEPKKEEHPGLSLLDGYGSSSSENEDNEKASSTANKGDEASTLTNQKVTESRKGGIVVAPSITNAEGQTQNYRTRVCRYYARTGKCRNGDACTFSHDTTTASSGNTQNNKNKSLQRGKTKTKSASTLLKKLLQTDADREATLTVQLLRYIVDCNYLQEQRPRQQESEKDGATS